MFIRSRLITMFLSNLSLLRRPCRQVRKIDIGEEKKQIFSEDLEVVVSAFSHLVGLMLVVTPHYLEFLSILLALQ